MAKKPKSPAWAQVVGTFDLAGPSGAITSIQPAAGVDKPIDGGIDRIHLKGMDKQDQVLFDVAVNPLINSCSPDLDRGTFEEYIPLDRGLVRVGLYIDGNEVGGFAPGRPPKAPAIALGAPTAEAPHRLPMTSSAPPAENVSYTIQARPTDDTIWQTVAIGLPTIDLGEVDINQFPDAADLEIRVLQSDGFNEREVFREVKSFAEPAAAMRETARSKPDRKRRAKPD